MKPIFYNGQRISIEHLAPGRMTCDCAQIGRDLLVSVSFANHCYTEAFDQRRHTKDQIVLYDAPKRARVFCPIRYGLSHRLPRIVAELPLRKVSQTSQRRNYVYILPLEIERQLYEVYFMLQRSQAGDGADLRLTIESAYQVTASPVLPKRPNDIRFRVLAHKVFMRQPVRFAPR